MITKAFVEEIISPYEARIRVPSLDGVESSPLAVQTSKLNIATICSLPNCYINVQVGDVVFVAFENNTYDQAVIIGHLCRSEMTETYADIIVNSFEARGTTKLNADTHIGTVTSKEISCLHGVKDPIQLQLDELSYRISQLEESQNN